MQIVTNNQARLQRYGIGYILDQGRPHEPEILQLKPGVNVVFVEEWERAKQLKTCQSDLDEDRVTEGAEVEDIASALADMDERPAKKLIKKTYSTDILEAWLGTEQRKPLRAAIRAQIEQATSPGVDVAPAMLIAQQAADLPERDEPPAKTKPRRPGKK